MQRRDFLSIFRGSANHQPPQTSEGSGNPERDNGELTLPETPLSRRLFGAVTGATVVAAAVAPPSTIAGNLLAAAPDAATSCALPRIALSTLLNSELTLDLVDHDFDAALAARHFLHDEFVGSSDWENESPDPVQWAERLHGVLMLAGRAIPKDPRVLLANPAALESVCRALLFPQYLDLQRSLLRNAVARRSVEGYRQAIRSEAELVDDVGEDAFSMEIFSCPAERIAHQVFDSLQPSVVEGNETHYHFNDRNWIDDGDLVARGITLLRSNCSTDDTLRGLVQIAFERRLRILRAMFDHHPEEVERLCSSFHNMLSKRESSKSDSNAADELQPEPKAAGGYAAATRRGRGHPNLTNYYRERMPGYYKCD